MKRSFFSILAVVAALAFAGTARADLQIAINDGLGDSVTYTGTGTNTVTYTVNSGAGTEGAAVYATPPAVPPVTPDTQYLSVTGGSVGALVFSTTQDMSNSPGTSGLANLHGSVTTLTNTGLSTATVTLAISGNNFLASNYNGSTQITASESLTNLGGPAITSIGYVDSGNNLAMPNGTPLAPLSAPTAGSGQSSSQYLSSSILGTDKFSLGQVVTFTLGAGQSVNFQAGTSVTPEPATLAAWGCGLGLIGLVRRRRRAAQTA